MRLAHVRMRGFRSLGKVDVVLSDYTSLIGKNDSGKSSFLRALQLLFDPEETPTDDDRCKIDNPAIEGPFYIEAVIEDCEQHELAYDGAIGIRRYVSEQGSAWYHRGKTPVSPTLEKMMQGSLTKQALNDDGELSDEILSIVTATLNDLAPSGKVPAQAWQAAFSRLVECELVEWTAGWCPLNPERLGSLVQVVMLKADVRAEEETTSSVRTVLHRIGSLCVQDAFQRHEGLVEAHRRLRQEIAKLGEKDDEGRWLIEELNEFESTLQQEIGRFDSEVTATSTLTPPRFQNLDFGLKVDVRDRWVSGLTKMGHGLRRSVVFAMLRAHRVLREKYISNEGGAARSATPLYLFLVEEPELYLHPQAETHRMKELQDLANLPDAQVILCTHSAFFVDLFQYRGIARCERPERGLTSVHQWRGSDLEGIDKDVLLMARCFDPTRAAMLFAEQVILVEGETEKVTVPHLAERMGIDTSGIEVVDCRGNGNIPVYQRVLEGLGIRYVAWLDSDAKNDVEKAKQICSPQHGRIVITPVNWERLAEISGDKVWNSWRTYVQEGREPNDRLKARIRAAYSWENFVADPVNDGDSAGWELAEGIEGVSKELLSLPKC
jgi:putative ATP-dependent endonuclease of OLD family